MENFFYDIALPLPLRQSFTYQHNDKLAKGTRVVVPFRNRKLVGYVLRKKTNSKIKSIKKIEKVLDEYSLLDIASCDLINWISDYYKAPIGEVYKSFFPPLLRKGNSIDNSIELFKITNLGLLINKDSLKRAKKQSEALEVFQSKKELSVSGLKAHNISRAIVKELERKTYVEKKVSVKQNPVSKNKINNKFFLKLNKEQLKVYEDIKKTAKTNLAHLIFGITGSGKTEVYFKIIKYYLLQKKQILILLPEIGLAHQWIDRFKKVFNFLPLNWNSSVSNNEKNKIWQTVSIGRPVVVVGTRSALFLPFTKLGLTIIDEENDISYKQEDSLIYNARDMAIVRAKFTSSHLLLVSATPSLETYWNSLKKKYNHTRISKRYGISTLPKIELINMYKEKGKIFSTKTQSEIKKNLQEGKQTLILINRRGYAPITLCVKCGRKQKCLNCDINLVLHKKSQLLVCHHCGYSKNINSQCEFCKGKGNIIHVGVGIERVLEEAKKIFDTKSLIALSSDTFNSKTFSDTLKKIENNEIKILIATQIISKGFNFLHLNKVFILDFDMWFYNSDIRTSEKIFQLTQQVAGRAGRGNELGKVYIQTYDIENSLLTKIKNNDRENFYKEELLFRERTLLPPFSKLVAIILQGKNLKDVERSSYKIKNLLSSYSGLTILGPIPAPIEFLNKQYRYRILIKSEHSLCIQKKIKSKVLQSLINSGIRIKIDVDPYSFF